jgi:hypothetical protein
MTEPKEGLYTLLKELDAPVYQVRPEVIKQFPCIVFRVEENSPVYELDHEIGLQQISILLDIFAKSSKESGELLKEVETTLREGGYRLSTTFDLPDPDGLSHLVCSFSVLI